MVRKTLLAALLASLYDIVHNQFVKLTSSMNMAIMGNAKLALLIVLSTLTLEAEARRGLDVDTEVITLPLAVSRPNTDQTSSPGTSHQPS